MSIFSRLARFFSSGDEPPSRLPSPDELAVVAHPEGEPEAQIIRDLLEGEGIHVMVRNRDAATAQSGAIGPAWAYEVWVMRKDLARARELIGEDDS